LQTENGGKGLGGWCENATLRFWNLRSGREKEPRLQRALMRHILDDWQFNAASIDQM
jgi:hypothetical protein